MTEQAGFGADEAQRIGEEIGIDWGSAPFDVEQFRSGMDVELEHGVHDPLTNVTGGDPVVTGKIALAHLNEFPDYYTRLARLEDDARREGRRGPAAASGYPETAGATPRGATLIVGVDGSPGAGAALRWALGEARLRGWPLRAVHSWTFPYMTGSGLNGYVYVDLEALQQVAEDVLERALAEVSGEAAGVQVERQVVQGPAAAILVAAAAPVDLLVVGSRGHGGFAGLLLGSVSQQCVTHAPCPVVVVHAPKPAATGDELGVVAAESAALS